MKPHACATISEADWHDLCQGDPQIAARHPLYAPLLAPDITIGRIAQSLDGRIATEGGKSFWISGPQDIVHTHRLRALCDAVIVGAGTVQADDPLLTTRHCAGASPVRVVIDTERRLRDAYRVFQGGPPTLLFTATPGPAQIGTAEVITVPRIQAGTIDLRRILATLRVRRLRRLFIEGGGITVSRFLAAGLLDRLHVTVAPLLLGAGIPAFTLPAVARPEDGLRLAWTVHDIGNDVLFDIQLRA